MSSRRGVRLGAIDRGSSGIETLRERSLYEQYLYQSDPAAVWAFEERSTQPAMWDYNVGAYGFYEDTVRRSMGLLKSGQSWSSRFVADHQYIRIKPYAFFDATDDFSYEFWIYPETLSGTQILLSRVGQIEVRLMATGNVELEINGVTLASLVPITANEWHQVVVTSAMEVYLDGAPQGSVARPVIPTPGTWVYLGRPDEATPSTYRGFFTFLSFFNKILSAEEVAEHHLYGIAKSYRAITNELAPYTYYPIADELPPSPPWLLDDAERVDLEPADLSTPIIGEESIPLDVDVQLEHNLYNVDGGYLRYREDDTDVVQLMPPCSFEGWFVAFSYPSTNDETLFSNNKEPSASGGGMLAQLTTGADLITSILPNFGASHKQFWPVTMGVPIYFCTTFEWEEADKIRQITYINGQEERNALLDANPSDLGDHEHFQVGGPFTDRPHVCLSSGAFFDKVLTAAEVANKYDAVVQQRSFHNHFRFEAEVLAEPSPRYYFRFDYPRRVIDAGEPQFRLANYVNNIDGEENNIDFALRFVAGLIDPVYGSAWDMSSYHTYCLIDRTSDLDLQDFTVEFWFRPAEVRPVAQRETLFGYFSGASSEANFDVNGGIHITYDNLGNLNFKVRDFTLQQTWTLSTALTLDETVHIAATRNATSGVLYLYVNGVQVDTDTGATGILNDQSEPTVDVLVGSWDQNLNAKLDEFVFHDSELSSTRILAHYDAVRNPP